MVEFILEVVLHFFGEILFKLMGASLRFPFFYKKHSFQEVLDKKWNGRIGFLVIFAIFITLTF